MQMISGPSFTGESLRVQTFRAWVAVVVWVLTSACSLSWAQQGGQSLSASLSPRDAVAAALKHHPDMHVARSVLATARAERSQTTLFVENPEADLYTSVDGSASELSASQPISLTGEGWAARSSASASVEAAELRYRRVQFEVAADAQREYTRALVARRQVELSAQAVELFERLSQGVARQHEAGEATLLAVRLARLELAQAASNHLSALEEQAGAFSTLSSLIGRATSPGELSATLDEIAATKLSVELEIEDRLDVQAAAMDLTAAQRELVQQRAATVPRVGVGVRVESEAGQAVFGPQVALQIPIFDRNQVGRTEAKALSASADSAVLRTTSQAEVEMTSALERIETASGFTDFANADMISEARAALTSVEAGVLAGEIDLPSAVLLQAEIIDGERAVIELSGRIARARIDLLLALEQPDLFAGLTP